MNDQRHLTGMTCQAHNVIGIRAQLVRMDGCAAVALAIEGPEGHTWALTLFPGGLEFHYGPDPVPEGAVRPHTPEAAEAETAACERILAVLEESLRREAHRSAEWSRWRAAGYAEAVAVDREGRRPLVGERGPADAELADQACPSTLERGERDRAWRSGWDAYARLCADAAAGVDA